MPISHKDALKKRQDPIYVQDTSSSSIAYPPSPNRSGLRYFEEVPARFEGPRYVYQDVWCCCVEPFALFTSMHLNTMA